MTTVFDFLTIAIFAGLIVLFLQRSVGENAAPNDHLWQYLVAAIGCAAANYLGNHDQNVAAVLLIVGTLAFIIHVLRPFPQFPRK